MKKLISIALSVAMVISVCSMPSYAIGYNKIVDNDLGGKTTYVGSEHLEEYIKKLEDEMYEAKNIYMDRYHIHPWKGYLLEWFPIALATAFNISLSFAVKIFNYLRLKNSLNANPQNPIPAEGLWEKSSLSFLQTMLLGVVSGATLFLGYIKSKDYNSVSQLVDADIIWSKNAWILNYLTNLEYPEFVRSIQLYGAEVVCKPSDFSDKLNTDCHVNSQEYLFDVNDEDYDPELASAIKLIDYKN